MSMNTAGGEFTYGAAQPPRRYLPANNQIPDDSSASEDFDLEDVDSYINPPRAPRPQQQRYPPLANLAQFTARPPSRPQFRSKAVCELNCKYCASTVCRRGMKVNSNNNNTL